MDKSDGVVCGDAILNDGSSLRRELWPMGNLPFESCGAKDNRGQCGALNLASVGSLIYLNGTNTRSLVPDVTSISF